jgi:formylglycine-generating enzyme required for sulfatase activity
LPAGSTVTEAGVPFRDLTDDTLPEAKAERPRRRRRRSQKKLPAVLIGVGAGALVVLLVLGFVFLKGKKTPVSGGASGQGASGGGVSSGGAGGQGAEPKTERPAPMDCTGPVGVAAADVRAAQEAWAKYLGRKVEETVEIGGVKMTFVLVPPGKFFMGNPQEEEDRLDNETLHEVSLTEPFDLGKTEVTQAQYAAVGGGTPSHFEGPNRPVEQVSWIEARDWAASVTRKRVDGHVYRLPTEAEWEYACRGGRSSSQPFGIGSGRTLTSREANFDGNFPYGGAPKGRYLGATATVASYMPNALGLYDMHGNVCEWCQDCYALYPRGAVTNPVSPEKEGTSRVFRGGSWFHTGRICRAVYRGWSTPTNRTNNRGFRLARSLPPVAR